MALSDYIYESDAGVSFQIRLDDTQQGLAGGVAGASEIDAHVRVSSSRREFGVQPRFATLKRLASADPNSKTLTTKLAFCTVAAYNAVAVNSSVTVNGVAYTVASKTPEIRR